MTVRVRETLASTFTSTSCNNNVHISTIQHLVSNNYSTTLALAPSSYKISNQSVLATPSLLHVCDQHLNSFSNLRRGCGGVGRNSTRHINPDRVANVACKYRLTFSESIHAKCRPAPSDILLMLRESQPARSAFHSDKYYKSKRDISTYLSKCRARLERQNIQLKRDEMFSSSSLSRFK